MTPPTDAPLPSWPGITPAASPKYPAVSVAAVTMVYNDPVYLKIWLEYYSRQLGAKNLYVVDHGSNDGSTDHLGAVNVIRLPRSPQDDPKRAAFLSSFCSSLLAYHDCVLHGDVDEILVADPRVAATLPAYCAGVTAPVQTAIGLNVLHRLGHETPYTPERRVLAQRPWVFRSSSMCKPALIRRPVRWSPGFHSADTPVYFGDLYLFHLRWFDLDTALRRLAKTRSMPWAHEDAGDHQRVSDAEMVEQFEGFGRLGLDTRDFDPPQRPLCDFLYLVTQSQHGRENEIYRISLDIWPDSLWRVPERFRTLF
ncbi:MAG: glycosyltransferase family 2 protein [Acetobacteraceae bacterium]|nr:glycosyltransferase family 2 protein [Acetobacteraceae bacterium]